MATGKWFAFLAGYFNKGFLNLPINVFVGDRTLVIEPNGLSLLIRGGKPYLNLSDDEIVGTRNVVYSVLFPVPALELRYTRKGQIGAFTIGFPGLHWQRRRFIKALREGGLLPPG
jgi:hypothetical protein